MTPDEVVKKAREENARKEKENKESKETFDRIFDKFKDKCWKDIEDEISDPDEIDQFEEEMERLRNEAWEAVKGDISPDDLKAIDGEVDDFLDFLFEELDDKEDIPNELLKRIKSARE